MSARNRLYREPDYAHVCDWTTEQFDTEEAAARRHQAKEEKMDTVYEYRTDERTEKVHLLVQMRRDVVARTLCGKRAADLVPGDETTSGIAATCDRCKAKRAARAS